MLCLEREKGEIIDIWVDGEWRASMEAAEFRSCRKVVLGCNGDPDVVFIRREVHCDERGQPLRDVQPTKRPRR